MTTLRNLAIAFAIFLFAGAGSVAKPADDLQTRVREEGFAAAQGMIVSSAADAMSNMALKLSQTKGELGALVQQAMKLDGQIAALNHQIDNTFDQKGSEASTHRADLQARVKALTLDLEKQEAEIARLYPAYAELTQPKPMRSAAVQMLLSSDEAMLLIIPATNGTYLFAVSKDKFDWARSGLKEPEVAKAVETLRGELASGTYKPFDRALAFRLYTELVKPLENVISGTRVLYTLTTGRLLELPLHVLVTQAPKGDDADPNAVRATRWLIDDYALVTLPAVSSLQTLRCHALAGGNCGTAREKAVNTGVAFAGVGDPVLDPSDRFEFKGATARQYSEGAYASRAALMSLKRVVGSRDELTALANHFKPQPTVLLLGDQATETRIKSSSEIAQARVLVFSTHALTASQVQSIGQPGLVLTPPAKPDDMDDGFLTATEVSQLHLSADFVVLSACNTAAPDGTPNSEWLSGLTRSFFYAGARSLLVSHWPVYGASTPVLMDGIIEHANKNAQGGRAGALQSAIQSMKQTKNWWHPRFWAAFALVGDSQIDR